MTSVWRLLVSTLALVLSQAGTTTVGAATYTYDGPAIARVEGPRSKPSHAWPRRSLGAGRICLAFRRGPAHVNDSARSRCCHRTGSGTSGYERQQ